MINMYELNRQRNILTIVEALKKTKAEIKEAFSDFSKGVDMIDENVSLTLQLALLERSKGLPLTQVLNRLEKLSKIAPKPFGGYKIT